MAFYVGQKVCCVDASPGLTSGEVLTLGKIYTVEGFSLVHPNEIFIDDRTGRSWLPSRFRPVVERKTDISIFKAMLNPSEQSVETV